MPDCDSFVSFTFGLQASENTVIVGDIGGTNARLSLWLAQGHHQSAVLFSKVRKTF